MRKLNINFEEWMTEGDKEVLHEFFPSQTLIAFDLETSGFSPHLHEILEVGACAIESYRSPKISYFHELVKNTRPISNANSKIHGITEETLKDGADIHTVLSAWKLEIEQYILSPCLLAHNAIFDIGHVLAQGYQSKIFCFPEGIAVYDSCNLARKMFKKKHALLANAKLATLASAFEINLSNHHALSDAWACALVFLRLLALAKKDSSASKEEILSMAYLCKIEDLKQKQANSQEELNSPIISALFESIKSGSSMEISYQSGSKGRNMRPIKPISLVQGLGGMILFADCLIDQQGKHFQVQKILDVARGKT